MIKNFKQFLNESKDSENKQSIQDGTEVIFNLQDAWAYEFDLDDSDAEGDELSHWDTKLRQLDGKKAIVDCLTTHTKLGDKDTEYYDIIFGDGTILNSISGYHLEPNF